MTTALEAVDRFLTRMYLDHGIILACVGGAARDTFLGRVPKDYDFVFLRTNDLSKEDLYAALYSVVGEFPTDLSEQGAGSEGTSASHGDAEARGLNIVWETNRFDGLDIKFQFLLYNDEKTDMFALDAAKAVVEHDCSLNHAWLVKVGGRIVARVTDEFPNPATGNKNFFSPDTNYERKAYIRDRFPEFNHQF